MDYEDNEQQLQRVRVQQQLNLEERLKVILILERKYDDCVFRTRKKIDKLVDNFLEELEDDIHNLLCNNKDYTTNANDSDSDDDDDDPDPDDPDPDPDPDKYCGLDIDRDTPAEVETVIRLFPRVLSKVAGYGMRIRSGLPIHYLSYKIKNDCTSVFYVNLKAVPFIPLVARLAIEFGSFEEYERGGLLIKDADLSRQGPRTVLNWLMLSDYNSVTLSHEDHVIHAYVDNKYLQVLIQLRRMGLLKKEDIRNYNLVYSILYNGGPGFAERRFRFLVEWDPTSLLQQQQQQQHTSDDDDDGEIGDTSCIIPLHHAAHNSYIHIFQFVFEYGIRYFPKKKGINLLFKINEYNNTPFQLACGKFGYEEVMKVVEDTLTLCYSSSTVDNSSPPPPLNIVEALIMAAIDENIHLDCVYFLLRRQPDVLGSITDTDTGNNNEDGDDAIGGGDDDDGDIIGNNMSNDHDIESVGDSDEYDGNDAGIQDDSNVAVKRNRSGIRK
jgi:hypothetical protein